MVSLIHSRALDVRNSEATDGKVATLISSDVGNMEDSARMFHETWAQFVEVVVGTFLLSRQVGWLWPLPLVLIFCEKRAPPPAPPGILTDALVADLNFSLLAGQSLRCSAPEASARKMERGYSAADLFHKLHPRLHQEYQDAGYAAGCSRSYRGPKAA